MIEHARYTLLLVLVTIHMGVLGLEPARPWNDLVNLVAAPLGALLLGRITGRSRDGWILLVLGGSGPVLNLLLPWGEVPLAVDLLKVSLWTAAPAFLGLMVFLTIYRSRAITHEEIAGVVTVYLLLALMFANVFEALFIVDPQALRYGDHFGQEHLAFGEILYFSFVTLSTLGYGDVAPGHPVARVVAVVESVSGLMFMGILIARFVSLHTVEHDRRRRAQD